MTTINPHHAQPETGTPPRQVHDHTTVVGHQVRGLDNGGAFCECGERQTEARGERPAAQAWRSEHLRTAWPVLLPREPNECAADWARRVAEAEQEAMRAWDEASPDGPIAPGQPYPVLGEGTEEDRLYQRAFVLEHLREVALQAMIREGRA